MKKSSLVYLISSLISSNNEKIIIGLILVNNDNIECYFDKENRIKLLSSILNKSKYKELCNFNSFIERSINDKTIKPSELTALPNNKGCIEIQSRKMSTIATIEEVVNMFM